MPITISQRDVAERRGARGRPGARAVQAERAMNEGFCTICCTQHGPPGPCPGELRATGPERHGWAIAVDAARGVEIYGVIVAPSDDVWRARVVTYPHAPWTIPGGRGTVKFVGASAGEAEARALQYVLDWCRERRRVPRDGFGPWNHPDGPLSRKPPPRKRRSVAIRYGANGATTLTTTGNLSPSGMFVTTPTPLPTGTILDLEMEIFDCSAQLRGEVVWTRQELEPGRPRGMGVHLLDPPPVYKLFVRGIV